MAILAGIKRQCSGTAERIDNCQIGVLLGYASCWRQGLMNRALYSLRIAHAAARRTFLSPPKTKLTLERLLHALKSGVTARWMTGDDVYGECLRLPWPHSSCGQGYVMEISRKTHVWHQRR